MLGLLAEKALALACAVQQRALDAETPEEMVSLAGAFAKLGRSVRQSIALHARLEKERLSAPRPAPPAQPAPPLDPHEAAAARKRDWVRRAVERTVWDEYDGDDSREEETALSLLDDLSDRLDDICAEDGFLDLDADALIAQLCGELRVTPPAARPASPDAAALARAAEGTSPAHRANTS